jgi:hypothetical protein
METLYILRSLRYSRCDLRRRDTPVVQNLPKPPCGTAVVSGQGRKLLCLLTHLYLSIFYSYFEARLRMHCRSVDHPAIVQRKS